MPQHATELLSIESPELQRIVASGIENNLIIVGSTGATEQ